jgi:TusA-related sulfurtransferase
LHLHVDREEVIAGMDAGDRMLDEERCIDPLAEEPSVQIREGADDGVDASCRNEIPKFLDVDRFLRMVASGQSDSSAWFRSDGRWANLPGRSRRTLILDFLHRITIVCLVRLDVSGFSCPTPVIKTRLALNELEPGATLEVITTDRGALSDIPALVRALGHDLVSVDDGGEEIVFRVCKR